jgi:hypothetical protein
MARTPKPLLVPVRLAGGGIMHDTDYARGAESVEHAAHIDNECLAKSGHMRWGADYIMAEVEPFPAYLRVLRVGHKSAYVELMDTEGRAYPMFLTDYVALMATASATDGLIDERMYETCKKGSAYGIRPVKEA